MTDGENRALIKHSDWSGFRFVCTLASIRLMFWIVLHNNEKWAKSIYLLYSQRRCSKPVCPAVTSVCRDPLYASTSWRQILKGRTLTLLCYKFTSVRGRVSRLSFSLQSRLFSNSLYQTIVYIYANFWRETWNTVCKKIACFLNSILHRETLPLRHSGSVHCYYVCGWKHTSAKYLIVYFRKNT